MTGETIAGVCASKTEEYSLKPKPYYLTPTGKFKWRSEIRRQTAKID
jgi:hypothetical protein